MSIEIGYIKITTDWTSVLNTIIIASFIALIIYQLVKTVK